MNISDPIKYALAAAAPIALLLLGWQFAEKRTMEDVALVYTLTRMRVGDLSAAELQLRNASNISIDDLKVAVPEDNLVTHQFEAAGPHDRTDREWAGSLPSDGTLTALFVFEGMMPDAEEFVHNIVRAQYTERRTGGEWIWKDVPLRERGIVTTLSSFAYVGWLLLPIAVCALVVIPLSLIIFKWWRGRQGGAQEPGPANLGDGGE